MENIAELSETAKTDIMLKAIENRRTFSLAIQKIIQIENRLKISALENVTTSTDIRLPTESFLSCERYTAPDIVDKKSHEELKKEVERAIELQEMIAKRSNCPIARVIDAL